MSKLLLKLKNNKNIVILISLIIIWIIIVISDFRENTSDNWIIQEKYADPYILITKWSAIIKRDKILKLKEKDKENIKIWDKIRTFEGSDATLFWQDWSITRLWEKTALTVTMIKSNNALSSTQVEINLEEWKTWSNIVKFLTNWSSFTETYEYWSYAATVRWTVFEMNLDNNYLHAVNHDVEIFDKNQNKQYMVPQWWALNMHNPKNRVPDEAWDEEFINSNLEYDKEFFNNLLKGLKQDLKKLFESQSLSQKSIDTIKRTLWFKKDSIEKMISDAISDWKALSDETISWLIPKMNEKEKYKFNQNISKVYQKIHALPNSDSIAEYKSQLRDILLQSSDSKDTNNLLVEFTKLDLFDYMDIKKNWNKKTAENLKKWIEWYIAKIQDPTELQSLLESFWKDMLESIWIDFWELRSSATILLERVKNPEVQERIKWAIWKWAQETNDTIEKIIK